MGYLLHAIERFGMLMEPVSSGVGLPDMLGVKNLPNGKCSILGLVTL